MSFYSIVYLYRKEDIIKNTINKWTQEEINILKKNYSSTSKECLLNLLPNRTWSYILTKANKLNINKRYMWTDEDDKLLIMLYENTDINEVVKRFPNRDKNGIIHRAMKLNLNSYNHQLWTKEDELYIINNWQLLPDEIIAKNIGKTKNAVKRKKKFAWFT